MTPTHPSVTAAACGEALATFRETGPLVQSLTNTVVTNWTANVLLAAGAAPAMVDNPHEAGQFARVASGVLVNLGTPQDQTVEAMREAVRAASEAGTPWVLDPVAAGGLTWRTEFARELLALAHAPAIVRGNASEIIGLAGGAGGRGVDSTDTADAALDAARALASEHACVVAVSGEVDHLTDGARLVRVHNGDALLTRVTGVGCSLGALMAGFAATCDDPLLAATVATGLLTVAADVAATESRGPGSFAVALLDRLALLTPDDLTARVRLDAETDGSAA
ncbi:hydroxyethylthiazole kinase [Mobilicoccus massiliensis]|uniref:hydroxyethylthiazole kinase n=1 Tax=Mobilicoccus massiliensis TaxID=1522310 RepID=UPI00058E57E3|nr:hydroxyethylthiazole kinase [Mobilicoccus massiliensis]